MTLAYPTPEGQRHHPSPAQALPISEERGEGCISSTIAPARATVPQACEQQLSTRRMMEPEVISLANSQPALPLCRQARREQKR